MYIDPGVFEEKARLNSLQAEDVDDWDVTVD